MFTTNNIGNAIDKEDNCNTTSRIYLYKVKILVS